MNAEYLEEKSKQIGDVDGKHVYAKFLHKATGLRLRQKRHDRKLSQVDAALRIGIGRTTLGRLERGDWRSLHIDVLLTTCRFFEASLDLICEMPTKEIRLLRLSQVHTLLRLYALLSQEGQLEVVEHAKYVACKHEVEDRCML